MNNLEILRTLAGLDPARIREALQDQHPIAVQYREDHGLDLWPMADGWHRAGMRMASPGRTDLLAYTDGDVHVHAEISSRGYPWTPPTAFAPVPSRVSDVLVELAIRVSPTHQQTAHVPCAGCAMLSGEVCWRGGDRVAAHGPCSYYHTTDGLP